MAGRGGGETPLHVLIVPSWYSHLRSPGGGSFFRDQAQALARAGHKVGILAPKVWGVRDYRAGPLPDMNLIAAEDEGFVRVWRLNTLHRLPRMPYRDSRAFCAAGRRLYDAYAAAEGQPDVLHGHAALYGGVLAADLSRRTGVPAVLTEHSTDYAQGKHRWWQKRLIRRALRDARARLAVSPQLHDILIDQYAGAARPLEVVPNILTPAFEANPPPTDEIPGPFIFLCVARISAEKNQDGLIRAFAQAFPEGDEELHFIGSGEAAELERLAREMGVAGRVKVLGVCPPEDVRGRMASAGAVVLASYVETFGVVVIEALSQGTPVVATISGGPEGILTPESGILIPPGDDAALMRALAEIRARAAAGEFDGQELRRGCLARYGEKAVVGELENIYAAALGGSNETGTT